MGFTHLVICVVLAGTVVFDGQAQRRSGGTATFAVFVADAAGVPLNGVRVIVEGPTTRQVTTERGRIALENLTPGTYRLRFERDGFITLEREVVARAGAPIDVKVTLRVPAGPLPRVDPISPPPPPPSLPSPVVKTDPVTLDISAFVEKNFVGRAAFKTSALACAAGGTATLLQVRDPIEEHTHGSADEFLYVVAGAGSAQIAGRDQPLEASVFTLIPRGVRHSVIARGRTPLVLLSIKAGEPCGAKTSSDR